MSSVEFNAAAPPERLKVTEGFLGFERSALRTALRPPHSVPIRSRLRTSSGRNGRTVKSRACAR